MAPESDALFLKRAVQAKLIDPEKGTAALAVYSQLKTMGAKFPFGQFLVDRGLMTALARFALESGRDIAVFSNLGDFEILDLLGEGQCATVFRARQRSLDRPVALKILNADFAADPANVRRFQAEARATARFSHPNIVQGFVTGSAHGMHFFAMEYIDGGSARAIAESSETGLDEPLALEIARQTAEGLRAAHAAGFVHRDVKPDNILVTGGAAVVTDFGIAHAIHEAREETLDTRLTATGSSLGTPAYLAPEQAAGDAIDARTDVYSWGVVAYEMLAGHHPFPRATTGRQLIVAHMAERPPMLAPRANVTPVWFRELVMRCMEKDPERRPANGVALVRALEGASTATPSIGARCAAGVRWLFFGSA